MSAFQDKCRQCGKEYKNYGSIAHRAFCSLACEAAWHREDGAAGTVADLRAQLAAMTERAEDAEDELETSEAHVRRFRDDYNALRVELAAVTNERDSARAALRALSSGPACP